MNITAIRKNFMVRSSLLGSVFWILSIQYFIVQVVAAAAWSRPYSLAHNTISDLGNSACGPYRQMFVCSPSHGFMNLSFVVLGITMIAGSLLIYRELRRAVAGFAAMCLAGLGTIMVGLFPENTVSGLHAAGAALPFLVGNVALILFGYSLKMPRALRLYTLASGALALTALILFLTRSYLGLGIGGMERLVAYPQTIWLIVFGTWMLYVRSRMANERQAKK